MGLFDLGDENDVPMGALLQGVPIGYGRFTEPTDDIDRLLDVVGEHLAITIDDEDLTWEPLQFVSADDAIIDEPAPVDVTSGFDLGDDIADREAADADDTVIDDTVIDEDATGVVAIDDPFGDSPTGAEVVHVLEDDPTDGFSRSFNSAPALHDITDGNENSVIDPVEIEGDTDHNPFD